VLAASRARLARNLGIFRELYHRTKAEIKGIGPTDWRRAFRPIAKPMRPRAPFFQIAGRADQ